MFTGARSACHWLASAAPLNTSVDRVRPQAAATSRPELRSTLVAAITIAILHLSSSSLLAVSPAPDKSPVSAEDSLKYFQLPDDLAIELVAAEPEVIDPIDMRFDE